MTAYFIVRHQSYNLYLRRAWLQREKQRGLHESEVRDLGR